ncbi:potassium channel family protein, partial [Tsukamurella soli]
MSAEQGFEDAVRDSLVRPDAPTSRRDPVARPAHDRWADAVEWVLVAASVVFLVAYATPVIRPGISPRLHHACDVATTVVWVLFGIDYVVRLSLSSDRWTFLRRHVFDLAILVLPILRPLRLLRLVALLSVLNRVGARSVRGRIVVYAVGSATMLLVVAALAITDAERGHPGSTIENFGDGLWWSITTMTTVGYGDHYPVTLTGKIVAAALMISGVTLLGVVTGTFASWIADRVAESTEAQDSTRETVAELVNEIRALRGEIADLRAERSGAAVPATAAAVPGAAAAVPG